MLDLIKRLGFYPRFCVWELTLACNLRCRHCGSFAGAQRDRELDARECDKVADDLAAMKCEKLTLGGGEPTLHPRWHEIGRRLSDQGVKVNIISNGWNWTREHVEKARQAGLKNVAFSLDGFEEAHDFVRRVESYRRVVEAIDVSISMGMPVSVVTHINTMNYKDLRQLRRFLGEHGVASWQLQLGIPSGSMCENQQLVIQPEDLLWLIPEIAEMRTEPETRPSIFPADNVGYFGRYEKALRDRGAQISFWIGCRAGCQVVGIESDGHVKGCLSLPSSKHGKDLFTEGSLREQDLASLWHRPDAFAFNRNFSLDRLGGFCAVCRYRDICRGGCAWTAYSHTENRFDNPYCFYRQALLHRRFDLLADEQPTEEELVAIEAASD